MEKKISIIIPCYNVERYIRRCLDSLLCQTIGLACLELICVNDASTDNTLSILLEYEAAYPDNFIIINFEENRKQGAARNAALTYASGDYIGYVDSDDYVEPDMFETLYQAIVAHDCDFVECHWNIVNDTAKRKEAGNIGVPGFVDLSVYENRMDYIAISIGMTALWNKLFKKSFLVENDIFCPEGLRYEDIFFCYLAYLYANRYYRVDAALYNYYQNEQGTVRTRHASYQFDKMDVMLFFFDVCSERGLYQKYPAEVEWMFLEKFYVYMLWEVFQEFPEQSYDFYCKLKNMVVTLLPHYKENPYQFLEANATDAFMLRLIEKDISADALEEIRCKLLQAFA